MRIPLIAALFLAAALGAQEPYEAGIVKFMTLYLPTHPEAVITLEAKDSGAGFAVYYAKWTLPEKRGAEMQPLIYLTGSRTILVGQYFNLAKFKDLPRDERFLGEFISQVSGASSKAVFKAKSKEAQEMEVLQETGFGKVALRGFLVSRNHLLVGNRYGVDEDPRRTRLSIIDPTLGGTAGRADAPRKLHVFLDLECPHCAKLEAELVPLVRARDDLSATFFQYPLTAGHPLSFKSAAASLCFLKEGSPLYLEFMEWFYPQRGDLELSTVDAACYGFAEQRELEEKFLACYMKEPNIREVLKAMQMAIDAGVPYTPALYLDGAAYRASELIVHLKATQPGSVPEDAAPAQP